MSGRYYLHDTGQEVQEAIDDVRNKTVYEEATQRQNGLMAAEDKMKLDQLNFSDTISIEELQRILT